MNAYYPRIIHAEHLRHRCFSFSVSSSRAISVHKLISSVEDDPYVPFVWLKTAGRGMVAGEELKGAGRVIAYDSYMRAMEAALTEARILAAQEVSKQQVNRILEPYAHVNVIVSGTSWANFFALRRHPAADPVFQELANSMWSAIHSSESQLVADGNLHLPCLSEDDTDLVWVLNNMRRTEHNNALMMICAARCAGGSYTLDGVRTRDPGKDYALGKTLTEGSPMHASPLEHVAIADSCMMYTHQHGNYFGFRQFRKTFANECVEDDYL
jgi:hypothetical protein